MFGGMLAKVIVTVWTAAIVAVLLWFGFAWSWAERVRELEGARTWPTVSGTIKSQSITEIRSRNGDRTYRPELQYTYTTRDGRIRLGQRLHSGAEPAKTRPWAEARLSGFQVGKSVTVYVNPADPGVSLLEPGMESDDWREACLLAVGAIAVVGLWIHALQTIPWRRRGYVAGVRIIAGSPVRCRQEFCGELAGSLYFGAVVALGVALLAFALDEGSLVWVAGTLTAGLVAAVPAWFIGRRLVTWPRARDLVLDFEKEVVVTPKLFDFGSNSVPMAEILDLMIFVVTRGAGRTKTTTYQVHLLLGVSRAPGPIALGFSSNWTAQKFSKWLEGELGLKAG